MGEKNAIVFYYIRAKVLYSKRVFNLHMTAKFCPFVMDKIVLPELFEESHQPVSPQ